MESQVHISDLQSLRVPVDNGPDQRYRFHDNCLRHSPVLLQVPLVSCCRRLFLCVPATRLKLSIQTSIPADPNQHALASTSWSAGELSGFKNSLKIAPTTTAAAPTRTLPVTDQPTKMLPVTNLPRPPAMLVDCCRVQLFCFLVKCNGTHFPCFPVKNGPAQGGEEGLGEGLILEALPFDCMTRCGRCKSMMPGCIQVVGCL